MGRITIFALDECGHCKRTKGALKEHQIPYTEISLSSHPNRRNDMLSLTDRLTVPQVFFNEEHVGGATETLARLKKWEEEDPRSVLEIFDQDIKSKPNPTNPKLAESTDPPVVVEPAPQRPESDDVPLPSGEKMSVLELTEKLKKVLPRKDLNYRMTTYKNCFTGKAAVAALIDAFGLSGEEEATEFGKVLDERNIIYHVVYEHPFDNTNDYYFRLQCHQTPDVLNSYRVWRLDADSNTMLMMKRLKKLMGKVESAVTDTNGGVNYKMAVQNENYTVFEEAVCELQRVNLSALDQKTFLAFGINVYNLMIKYAFMKVGIGSSDLGRLSFFNNVKFNIGGHVFSFQDWENGILRGNRTAPASFSPQLGKKDARLPFVLSKPDCRIHFALNCGAKSCPPVKEFTSEGIEEELRIVAMAFCEDDDNVSIDSAKRTLNLSKILSWYRVDFAESNAGLPQKVVEFLRGEKKQQLQELIDGKKTIKVAFNHYDWGTNASEFVSYTSSALDSSTPTIVHTVGSLFS